MTAKLDPEQFRVQVGQFAERWYVDPLPACPVAPDDPDFKAPSVSTIKRAASKDWTQVSLNRVGKWIEDARPDFSESDAETIGAALRQASGAGLDLAAGRGTQVHRMFEAHADGDDPATIELTVEAMHFRRSVLRCIAQMQPNVALSEFVAISREHQYGGTADAVWVIDGEYWIIDYKSRESAEYQAYLEEAWQLAAYAGADYWIVPGDNGPERMEPLELKGGLIIAINKSGYRCIPIELDRAYEGFLTLRNMWGLKNAGRKGIISKAWAPPMPTRDEWIRDRIEHCKNVDIRPLLVRWPQEIQTPKHHPEPYADAEIEALLLAVQYAEAQIGAPWPDPDPKQFAPEPVQEALPVIDFSKLIVLDEGDLMEKALEGVRYRYAALPQAAVEWISNTVRQASDAGLPIRVAETPTARRIFIARALILGCEQGVTAESFHHILESVETEHGQGRTLGARLGALSWEQASVLAGLVSIAKSAEATPAPVEPPMVVVTEYLTLDPSMAEAPTEPTKPSRARKAPSRTRKATT